MPRRYAARNDGSPFTPSLRAVGEAIQSANLFAGTPKAAEPRIKSGAKEGRRPPSPAHTKTPPAFRPTAHFVSDLKDQAKATLVTRGRRRIAAPIAPKPISVIAQVAGSGTLGAGGTARLAEAE